MSKEPLKPCPPKKDGKKVKCDECDGLEECFKLLDYEYVED